MIPWGGRASRGRAQRRRGFTVWAPTCLASAFLSNRHHAAAWGAGWGVTAFVKARATSFVACARAAQASAERRHQRCALASRERAVGAVAVLRGAEADTTEPCLELQHPDAVGKRTPGLYTYSGEYECPGERNDRPSLQHFSEFHCAPPPGSPPPPARVKPRHSAQELTKSACHS